MRAPLLLAVLLLPAAAAQQPGQGERVDVVAAEFPPVLVADRSFFINVTVQNREAAAQRVLLFATLYQGSSATPCEGARAVQSLSRFQNGVDLAPGEQATVEGWRDHWTQVVNGSRVPADGTYEVCVWARAASCPGPELPTCFLDHLPLQQRIRLRNAPPPAAIVVEPRQGGPDTRFAFRAEGADPDGDEVLARWDFGDGEAAQGRSVAHRFGRAGAFQVRLHVTDGWDAAEATRAVEVAAGGGGGGNGVPGAPWLAALAVAAVAARARRR